MSDKLETDQSPHPKQVVNDKGESLRLYGKPSQSYGASPAIWDQTCLPTQGECVPH